jgi:hypothetical protein
MTAANGVTNGVSHPVEAKSTDYGHEAADKSFRLLIADLCQQFGGGHPG